jgi:hypothetical protein
MAVAILYNDLSAESKKSAGTGANLQGEVRDDVKKSDASSDETDLRAQVLAPWADANYGDPELAPWPVYGVDPAEDLQALATMWSGVALALKNLDDAGYEVDLDEVREVTGLPITGKAEPQPMPPALAAAAGIAPDGAEPGKAPAFGAPKPKNDNAEDAAERVERLTLTLGLRNALELSARVLGAPLSPSELRSLARMPAAFAAQEFAALFADRGAERQRAVARALSAQAGSRARAELRAERMAA